MNSIKLTINKYAVSPNSVSFGTEKSYGFEKISFSFSPEWSGLFKTVTFYPPKKKPVSIEGIEAGVEYDVPAEVTARGGVGEYVASGYADGKKLYSVSGTFEVLSSRSEQGVAPDAPTPTEIDQIRQYALDAKIAAEEADIAYIKQTPSTEDGGENIVEIGLKNGETYKLVILNGSKGSKGEKGDKGDKGDKGYDGDNYVLTEKDKSDIAALVPGGGDAKFIGYTMFVPYYGELPDEGELDVTETITYKPEFSEAAISAFKPMFFAEQKHGMPEADGFTFHNYYTFWSYYENSIDIYFHSYTPNGIRKKIRLHYQYTEEDTSAPQSITAYLTTENPIGDIETALDGIIEIQEALMVGTTNVVLDDLHEYAQNIVVGGDT